MGTKNEANIFIQNKTNSKALIRLYHNNSSGTQSQAFRAEAGQTVGPLEVFWGSEDVLDYWAVRLTTLGEERNTYGNTGSFTSSIWKECQLGNEDAGQDIYFSVSESSFKINLKSGGCSNGMKLLSNSTSVNHIFVLMLENHSFDNIFAMSGIEGIRAATTADYNSYQGQPYHVEKGAPPSMPTDPGHEFSDTVKQLCGQDAKYSPGGPYPPINNSGFVADYATSTTEGPLPPKDQIGKVMHCFDTPRQLPVIHTLAREFAVLDQWYSSIPGPTWPNRFFVHGASSNGMDDSPSTSQIITWETVSGYTLPNGSIFDQLRNKGIKYRLYNDWNNQFTDHPEKGGPLGKVPQVSALKGIKITDVNCLSSFREDLNHAPYDHGYTFIEPNYGSVRNGSYAGGSSQHPMDDPHGGEGLIAFVYENIRNSPLWYDSLLIISYDEHGGFYDSQKPPAATPPNDGGRSSRYNKHRFRFDQLGVRVPAVAVSPHIQKGTVDHTIYDHSSVLKTIEEAFKLSPLTQRDANANGLNRLLSLDQPRLNCPGFLPSPEKSEELNDTSQNSRNLDAPLPEEGNLIGSLGILFQYETAQLEGFPDEQEKAKQRFMAMKTFAEAEDYANHVIAKAELERVANRKSYLQGVMPPESGV